MPHRKLEALEELVSLVEEETGCNTTCKECTDDESVGWAGDGELPMTFGHIRRARKELEQLKLTVPYGG